MGYRDYKPPTRWERLMDSLNITPIPVFTRCPCSETGIYGDTHRCKLDLGHEDDHESNKDPVEVNIYRNADGSIRTKPPFTEIQYVELKGQNWGIHRNDPNQKMHQNDLSSAEHDYYFRQPFTIL